MFSYPSGQRDMRQVMRQRRDISRTIPGTIPGTRAAAHA
jgi:hypothetical protein